MTPPRCPVCGTTHRGFTESDGRETAWCPSVPGNTQSRYAAERREVGARGVATGHLNDAVFDDLALAYGSRPATVEAMCADPRPHRVEYIAGPRFTTEQMERI